MKAPLCFAIRRNWTRFEVLALTSLSSTYYHGKSLPGGYRTHGRRGDILACYDTETAAQAAMVRIGRVAEKFVLPLNQAEQAVSALRRQRDIEIQRAAKEATQ